MLINIRRFDRNAKRLVKLYGQLDDSDRIATQRLERRILINKVDIQQLSPELGDLLFRQRHRSFVGLQTSRHLGRRQ